MYELGLDCENKCYFALWNYFLSNSIICMTSQGSEAGCELFAHTEKRKCLLFIMPQYVCIQLAHWH